MTKQQLLGRKRGSAKNNNDKVVPDFGDLMDAGCAMVQAPADMDAADALTLSYEPQDKHENRPLSPGAILEKAEQDATKMNNSITAATKIIRKDPKAISFWKLPIKEETEISEYPHLDYLFDFDCKGGSLTYDPETCKPYDIIYDPNDLNNSDYVLIRETLQAEPVFQRIDARVTPELEQPVATDAKTGADKKRKRKSRGRTKVIVDADVEMLENWTAEIDEKAPVDYGKMRKEQRKRFEKMGIHR